MLDFGLGAGLIIIALVTQWLISKRLKNQKVSKIYSWIAWTFAVVGGAAVTGELGPQVGATSAGAVITSVLLLLFIVVDVADRRPDWPAFICICLAPTFMRLSGGQAGEIFDVLLALPDWLAGRLGTFLGM